MEEWGAQYRINFMLIHIIHNLSHMCTAVNWLSQRQVVSAESRALEIIISYVCAPRKRIRFMYEYARILCEAACDFM